MRTNVAIPHEIGKPTPVSPKNAKSKGVAPIKLDSPATLNITTYQKYEKRINELLKEVVYYQKLCVSLNEELIKIRNKEIGFDARRPVLVATKGGSV